MKRVILILTGLLLFTSCQNPAEPVRDNINDVGYYKGTQLETPADGAVISLEDSSILFSWDKQPMQHSFSYSFQITREGTPFSSDRVSVGQKHEYEYPTDTLSAGTTYQWRAGRNWFKDGEHVVYWSETRSFSVGSD